MKPRVIILGAGPAGLAATHDLCEKGFDVILIEKEMQVGGLAKTLEWPARGKHDLGPHKIFTTDLNLFEKVKKLLKPDQWLTREKVSRIYMYGHYMPYPPSPFSLLKVFGPIKFFFMVFNYGITQIKKILLPAKAVATFEEDLHFRVGPSLYQALFQPIALKLWGHPSKLDAKLSQGRVQTPKVTEVVSNMLGIRKKSQFEALSFIYPKGGLQNIWESILNKPSVKNNTELLLGYSVKNLQITKNNVNSLTIENAQGNTKAISLSENDYIFSTVPIGLLPKLMTPFLESESKTIKETVILNDLFLVFLVIDKKQLMKDSWVFVPDPEIVFHRISEQESFDTGMSGENSIVCCEIMSGEDRMLGHLDDAKLVEMSKDGITKMNLGPIEVLEARVIRLPNSYPVYRPHYEEKLAPLFSKLDQIKNFKTIGRQGSYNYIGTLDAMDIGFGAANWYSDKSSTDKRKTWELERQRTSHFPVLD